MWLQKVGGFFSEGKKVNRWNIIWVGCGKTGIDYVNDDFRHIVPQTGKDIVRYPIMVWGAGFGVCQQFPQVTYGDHRAGHRGRRPPGDTPHVVQRKAYGLGTMPGPQLI